MGRLRVGERLPQYLWFGFSSEVYAEVWGLEVRGGRILDDCDVNRGCCAGAVDLVGG